ncbi:MAG: M48 family metallopeptidase [Clostridia bacterium]|nr:M48 family metallopeptidase [Clostridia bacterium]
MINYQLTRSKRKTVCIVVHKDASVEVRAPLKMKQAEIDSFVISKESWINKAVAKVQHIKSIEYGSVFPFLGNDYTVTAHSSNTAIITEDKICIPANLEDKEIVLCLNSFLMNQAKQYIPKRVRELSEKTGISCSSVLINSAKTHWGSCTKDRLHFSCHLMLADKAALDYVIIHELVHIHHPNHSGLFWAEVKKHCPDYINCRNRLKLIGSYTF